MNVLLIGFGDLRYLIKAPPEHSLDFPANFIRYNVNLFDLDAVIIRSHKNNTQEVEFFFKKFSTVSEFLRKGGIVILFCEYIDYHWLNQLFSAPSGQESIAMTIFLERPFLSQKAKTQTIKLKAEAGILSGIIKKFDSCEYYFSNYPPDSVVLAADKANHPLALKIPFEEGVLFLLPGKEYTFPKDYAEVISSLLEILPKLKNESEEIRFPEWLSQYKLPEEEELNKKKSEIEEKLKKIRTRKELLVAKGKRLEAPVKFALEQFGFVVEEQKEGAYVDFILKIGNKEVAGVEVTSSTKQIGVKEFRQLLHFLTDCEIEKREIKGIIVGNHFYEKTLSERGEPFTQDAVNSAEKHKVCLVTTVELFNALQKLDEGKIKPEEVREKLLNTVGICKI